MSFDVSKLLAVRPQTNIHYFATLGSTMPEAHRLAVAGATHGTIVLADEQTAGLGRLGRNWISEPEVGIYCSILLRLNLSPAQVPIANFLPALAVVETIQSCTSLTCDLRWPNDVLVRDRKICGILAQMADDCVIAGIGINVNQTGFEAGLRTPATSLQIETGHPHEREPLVATLLDQTQNFSDLLDHSGCSAILRAFSQASSYTFGRRVTVEETGTRGVTAGLDDGGFLLLRTNDGKIERIAAGGVRAAASA
jgi:BirA family biotin operon repressor/biotin-[acetyl-CoA-carboxylase] ligase